MTGSYELEYPHEKWEEMLLLLLPAVLLSFFQRSECLALKSFDLDLDHGTLALTFDKAVSDDETDSDWTGVTLRSHSSKLEAAEVTLWHTEGALGWGSPVTSASSLTLTVGIHPIDLDEIKAVAIGHNESFTWLVLREGSFWGRDDGAANDPVYGTEVLSYQGMQVSSLTVDETSPTLERFVFSRERRSLFLFFMEAVDLLSLNTSALALGSNKTMLGGGTAMVNITLGCSGVEYGPRAGTRWRELVVHLDHACENDTQADQETDWGILEAEGIVEEQVTGGWVESTVLLDMTADFISDYSYSPNSVHLVEDMVEEYPDCQPCSNGTYRSSPCTDVYDALCTNCTVSCQQDHFELVQCTIEGDLDCHRCTPCPFGTYETGGCDGGDIDRTCKVCTVCTEGEYVSRDCSRGEDAVCESCLRCSYTPAQAMWCRNSVLANLWRMEECCQTSEGFSVPCVDLQLEETRIDTRKTRRHWVFEPSIPEVEGHTQTYWGTAAHARDGVRVRDGVRLPDRLVEVEMKAEGLAILNDPQYAGQGANDAY
ncbi:unnamed protein product [Discosporangium mesarthrocarpum]